MYKWAIRRQIRRNIEALNRGDPEPLLKGYAADAVLVFPGESSWGGEHRGRAAIEAFLRRFVATGLTGEAEDVLVNGPRWRGAVRRLERVAPARLRDMCRALVAIAAHAARP